MWFPPVPWGKTDPEGPSSGPRSRLSTSPVQVCPCRVLCSKASSCFPAGSRLHVSKAGCPLGCLRESALRPNTAPSMRAAGSLSFPSVCSLDSQSNHFGNECLASSLLLQGSLTGHIYVCLFVFRSPADLLGQCMISSSQPCFPSPYKASLCPLSKVARFRWIYLTACGKSQTTKKQAFPALMCVAPSPSSR